MKKRYLNKIGSALALTTLLGTAAASAQPWKFGVLSDTQWTGSPDDGKSPGTTPAGIIQQVNQAFIAQGVKFVIAVGDTVDTGSKSNLDIRALYAQDLYNAGIGFFPFRGNHESGWTGSAAEEARIYPQIVNGGTNNLTPSDIPLSLGHDTLIDPVAPSGVPFVLGGNFSYPTNVNGTDINATYGSLSYSFDYNNVRFVLIDQFENANPGGNTSSAPLQQPWITLQLADPARPQHAFVFDHKNLLGGNHKDNIMGAAVTSADPGDGAFNTNSLTPSNMTALVAKQQALDAFITALATNKVHYYISGHDHHHYDSIVQSPLSTNRVHQIISASDSSKFYTPSTPASTNDTPISQDLYKLGYYIYTVDGPRVTVDYYGVDVTTDPSYKVATGESIVTNTPVLTGRWQKILTYGYSLDGQEFVIPQGSSYTIVADTTAKATANGEAGYLGTAMQILGGINTSTATNNYGKAQSKAVDSGWTPASGSLASDILSLWGLTGVGSSVADTVAISLSYNPAGVTLSQMQNGSFGLLAQDANSNWVNAVTLNAGGTAQFVFGPYSSGYSLGTYGVDTNANVVWAVINYQGNFAAGIAQLEQPVTLAGPANGTVVSSGSPTLSWTPVVGASGYTVGLTYPNGSTSYYNVVGNGLLLSFPLSNGAYSWNITPYNGSGYGPASATGTFTMQNSTSSTKWSFGVIDDTQWTTTDPAGQNPNTVSVSIINQINARFIGAGVKFVIEVGDLTDTGEDANEMVRAAASTNLYNAGIGFFPIRGNHETYGTANNFAIPVFQNSYPQTRGLANTFGAVNFNSPVSVSSDLNGMTYSFDFGAPGSSARFIMLDTWATPSKVVSTVGYDYGYSIADQQAWLNAQLDQNTRGAQHAFVFCHQPLIAENHQDSPFVGYTDANPDMQNAFLASLYTNNVKYYISGHDHIHQRSLITSPDGLSKVEEIIGASDSSKFYTPKAITDANWHGQKVRELSLSQERYTVGYYIYTIDGARVTVDYYSDDHGNWGSDGNYPVATTGGGLTNRVTPTFHFVKKESWGYSLNGAEFTVAQGQPYTSVLNSIPAGNGFLGTTAAILGGTNASTTVDGSARPLTKAVDTAWSSAAGTYSDVLSLWGLTEVGAAQGDTVAVSLTYNAGSVSDAQLNSGLFCLATKDANGNWINAVNANLGGTKTFVNGPWNASYGLGTYGVDKATGTVWAVVNYQGDFAAVQLPPSLQIAGPDAQGNMNITWPAALLPGYILQYCPDLNTTNWVTIGNQGFFRLVKP